MREGSKRISSKGTGRISMLLVICTSENGRPHSATERHTIFTNTVEGSKDISKKINETDWEFSSGLMEIGTHKYVIFLI